MPKLSSRNSLSVCDRPSFLELTVVENLIIAPQISFMTLIKLPVSRMLGIRRKIVNVPIPPDRIKENVESLPRTLQEAEVIPVAMKRKKSMITSLFEQHVRPEILRQAVRYLKGSYPYYKDVNFDMRKLDKMMGTRLDELEEDLDNITEATSVKDVFVGDEAEETGEHLTECEEIDAEEKDEKKLYSK